MQRNESGAYEIAGPTLTEFIREIISVEDPAAVVAAAVSRCLTLARADGAVVLVSNPGAHLRGVGRLGQEKVQVSVVMDPFGAGVAGAVARTHEPTLVADVALDPRFDAAVDSAGVPQARSIISVPLLAHGELLGVLQVIKGAHRRPFTNSERDLLTTISPHVAIAVFNALTLKRLREAQALATVTQADLEQKVQQRTAMLVAAKREWESTVDAISEPLALLKDMTVTRANLAYARKAGVDVRDVPRRKCFELLAGRRAPCPGCPVIDAATQPGPRQAELRIGAMHLQVSTFPAGESSVVVHYRDVSEQRVLESKLRHSERLASLGQLASGAAHEINNPLGFLISNLRTIDGLLGDVAKEAPSTATLVTEARQVAADSLGGAERVSAIVRGLRAMARQQTGGVELFQLEDAATRALHTVLGRDSVEVVTDFSADALVRAVPLSLDQAIGNVLVNARQAVQQGGKITVSTGRDGAEAWLKVADEGPGIPAAVLPKIFDPFFSTRGVGGGVGLGLTAVWSIVTALGGRVEVESTVGRGSTFTLVLPRHEAPAGQGTPRK